MILAELLAPFDETRGSHWYDCHVCMGLDGHASAIGLIILSGGGSFTVKAALKFDCARLKALIQGFWIQSKPCLGMASSIALELKLPGYGL